CALHQDGTRSHYRQHHQDTAPDRHHGLPVHRRSSHRSRRPSQPTVPSGDAAPPSRRPPSLTRPGSEGTPVSELFPRKRALTLLLCLALPSSAWALETSRTSRLDHRVPYVNYDPANVIQLDAVIGVATH